MAKAVVPAQSVPLPEAVHDAAPAYGLAGTAQDAVLYRMPFAAPLLGGELLRRRDRFLADIRLDSGETIVAHCVNTGRMEGLTRPGRRVYVSRSTVPGRRLAFTWELTEVDGILVGTNTAIPNRLVLEMMTQRLLAPFADHSELRPERRFGERSRVDFWFRQGGREHYLEVKNCHLVYPDQRGYFPDSVSERATHHLHELSAMVAAGHAATVLFVVQRHDATTVRPSDAHDPAFAQAARLAQRAGVRFLGLVVAPQLDALVATRLLPVDLEPYEHAQPAAWRELLRAEAPAWETSRQPGAKRAEEGVGEKEGAVARKAGRGAKNQAAGPAKKGAGGAKTARATSSTEGSPAKKKGAVAKQKGAVAKKAGDGAAKKAAGPAKRAAGAAKKAAGPAKKAGAARKGRATAPR